MVGGAINNSQVVKVRGDWSGKLESHQRGLNRDIFFICRRLLLELWINSFGDSPLLCQKSSIADSKQTDFGFGVDAQAEDPLRPDSPCPSGLSAWPCHGWDLPCWLPAHGVTKSRKRLSYWAHILCLCPICCLRHSGSAQDPRWFHIAVDGCGCTVLSQMLCATVRKREIPTPAPPPLLGSFGCSNNSIDTRQILKN